MGSEISCFAENMSREIYILLLLDKLTSVASQSSLIGGLGIAGHRHLQNIPADDEQTMQVVGIEELPGPLAPLAMRMVAHKFRDLEIVVQFSD